MTKAINSQTRVAYVVEAVAGTTPATPAFKVLRATGEGLDAVRKHVFSSELNGARGQKNFAVASASGAGEINFEFSDATLEDLLESALRGAWAADVLKDGNTPKTFTLEATFEAGGTDIYKRFVGAEVNTLTLNMRASENVTGALGFMSRTGAFANAAIAGATYAAGNTEPIAIGADVGSLALAGLTVGCVSSLTLSINNNLAARECLGSLSPTEFGAGKIEVTGTIAMLLDAAQYDVLTAFADGTPTGLSFQIGDTAGKILGVSIPNVILEGLRVASESEEGDVIVNTNFRALQAASLSNSVIQLTRNI